MQDILNQGVGAGDTVNFVAHSGGGQRMAAASRILGDYDIYGNALLSITGPVMGRYNNINTIGLVGSPSVLGEPTSALQYGLSWAVAARASNGVLPYQKYFVPGGGAIPHQTPIYRYDSPDTPYFDYLNSFLRLYGGYGAPRSQSVPSYGYPFGSV